MLNVSFYIFTMSMLNVSLDKCKVAMEVGLRRGVFRSTFADDSPFVDGC